MMGLLASCWLPGVVALPSDLVGIRAPDKMADAVGAAVVANELDGPIDCNSSSLSNIWRCRKS